MMHNAVELASAFCVCPDVCAKAILGQGQASVPSTAAYAENTRYFAPPIQCLCSTQAVDGNRLAIYTAVDASSEQC